MSSMEILGKRDRRYADAFRSVVFSSEGVKNEKENHSNLLVGA